MIVALVLILRVPEPHDEHAEVQIQVDQGQADQNLVVQDPGAQIQAAQLVSKSEKNQTGRYGALDPHRIRDRRLRKRHLRLLDLIRLKE